MERERIVSYLKNQIYFLQGCIEACEGFLENPLAEVLEIKKSIHAYSNQILAYKTTLMFLGADVDEV